jgi:hypothetical protein
MTQMAAIIIIIRTQLCRRSSPVRTKPGSILRSDAYFVMRDRLLDAQRRIFPNRQRRRQPRRPRVNTIRSLESR